MQQVQRAYTYGENPRLFEPRPASFYREFDAIVGPTGVDENYL